MRLPPCIRALPAGLLLAICACSTPPVPADAGMVDEWNALTRAAVQGTDPRLQARVAALGALVMYESFAAEHATAVRSLAGQVNGLWSVPAPERLSIDGAVAAAEAQRVVLDSLFAANADVRRRVDSLAAAQIAARRAAGIRPESAERSRAYGATLARAVLALGTADAQRTLVLRHPQECTYRVATASTGIVSQGAAATAAIIPVLAAAESRLLEALVTADSLTVATRRAADDAACVRAVVQGRIRTRAAAP